MRFVLHPANHRLEQKGKKIRNKKRHQKGKCIAQKRKPKSKHNAVKYKTDDKRPHFFNIQTVTSNEQQNCSILPKPKGFFKKVRWLLLYHRF
ncbi:hypothetical protein EVA_01754 [gut metagenome]|uniref:Uncharacterized protein n=1 Tax=gut metagenome TaxID=749906 RepID=J9GQP5_9ZZZZ